MNLFKSESNDVTPYLIECFVLFGLIGCAFSSYWMFQELRLSKAASLIGATVFAFAGFTFDRQNGQLCIFNSIIWLPFVVAAYLRANKQDSAFKRILWLHTSAFGLAMTILSGHYLGFIYSAVVILSYSIFQVLRRIIKNDLGHIIKRDAINKTTSFFITIIFGILLASIQLIPTLEYSKLSLRWVNAPNPVGSGEKIPYSVLGDQFHFTPAGLFSVINPDLASLNLTNGIDGQIYSGIVAIILGALAFYKLRKSNDNVLFFATLFLISIVYSLGGDSILHSVYNIFSPLADPIRTSSRISFLSHFAISGLAAYGIDYLWKKEDHDLNSNSLINKLIKFCLSIILLFLLSVPFLPPEKYALMNSLLMTLLLATIGLFLIKCINLKDCNRKRLIVILLSLLIIQDTYYFYVRRLPQRVYEPPQKLYPSEIVKVYAPILKKLEGVDTNYRIANLKVDEIKNFGNVLGIKMTMAHGASMPKNYFNFLDDLGWNNERINNLLSARYIINPNTENIKGTAKITENISALPIYRISYKHEVIPNRNEAISRLSSDNFDYKSTVILNEKPDFGNITNTTSSLSDLPNSTSQEVSIQAQYPNQVKLLVTSSQPAILVFADQMYPGWTASVNDIKVKVIEANTIFKAIAVPAGISNVVFQYRPNSFIFGLLLSALSISFYLFIISKNAFTRIYKSPQKISSN